MGTKSERLFEQYCDTNAIPWERVPVATHRTPDYAIQLGDASVICEVKQLEMSNRERSAWREALAGRTASAYFPGNRLRRKLKDVSGQLKNSSQRGVPTLLVVFDNSPFQSDLDHTTVVQAIFGDVGYPIRISDTADSQVESGEPFFSGGRGFTSSHNTSVSALAVLEGSEPLLRLRVYHNLHAAVVLDPALMSDIPVDQRVLPGDTSVSLD